MKNTYLNLEPLCLTLFTFSPVLCIGMPSWKSFHFAEFWLYLTTPIVLKKEDKLQQGTVCEKDPWSQAVCSATTFAETPFNEEQIFVNMISSAVAQHEVPAIYEMLHKQLD